MSSHSPLKPREILSQVVSDWFGKDVQSGYTLSYIWMANELGHFTIGFAGPYLLLWVIALIRCVWTKSCCVSQAWTVREALPFGVVVTVAGLWLAFWVVKEVIDCWLECSKVTTHVFKAAKREIWRDAFTADFFIAFGTCIAVLNEYNWKLALAGFFVFMFGTFFIGRYWLACKMCFQRAGLPFQYRLSGWPNTFAGDVAASVQRILSLVSPVHEPQTRHLMIFGGANSRKSDLAIAMATEWGFSLGAARYTTFYKFLQFADKTSLEPRLIETGGQIQWNWILADLLIVDDVSPGEIVTVDGHCVPSTPEEFECCLKGILRVGAGEGLAHVKHSRTVWVIGHAEQSERWVTALANSLGVSTEEIAPIMIA